MNSAAGIYLSEAPSPSRFLRKIFSHFAKIFMQIFAKINKGWLFRKLLQKRPATYEKVIIFVNTFLYMRFCYIFTKIIFSPWFSRKFYECLEDFRKNEKFAKFNQLCKISYFREHLIMYLSFNLTWNFFVFFFGKIFHCILHLFHRSLYIEKVTNFWLRFKYTSVLI